MCEVREKRRSRRFRVKIPKAGIAPARLATARGKNCARSRDIEHTGTTATPRRPPRRKCVFIHLISLGKDGEPCRTELHKQYQEVGRANHQETPLDSIHKNETLANLKSLAETKENAANLAGFNGAKDVVEGVYSCGKYIAASPSWQCIGGALV